MINIKIAAQESGLYLFGIGSNETNLNFILNLLRLFY